MRDALKDTRFRRVRWVDETGSTNDDLLAEAQRGGPEQVLITDLQTAGRGRRGRVWDAPSQAGLLMSVLIRGRRPEDAFWSVGAVALAASLAIDEVVDAPSAASLKWPNDVLLDGAKVAGVLAQVVDDATIVGIGINTNWPDAIPESFGGRATAINHHRSGNSPVDRGVLAARLVELAAGHLDANPQDLRRTWMERCSTLGCDVRIERQTEMVVGRAVDVTADGALVLEQEGSRSVHQVGDVVHLRRSDDLA